MRTLVVIRPNQTAASGVCGRMVVPRGEFLATDDDARKRIVLALAAALRGWVNHPRNLAPGLKRQKTTLAIRRARDVIDMCFQRLHLPHAIHVTHEAAENLSIPFSLTDGDSCVFTEGRNKTMNDRLSDVRSDCFLRDTTT